MNKSLFTIAMLLLGGLQLIGQSDFDIVHVISSSDENTSEITFDGTAICVGNDQGDIIRLDPDSGEVISILSNPLITTCGLGFDGIDFIAESKNKDKLYYLDKDDLSILDSITPPHEFSGFIEGITWDGNLVWFTIFHFGKLDTLYNYDPVSQKFNQAPFMDKYSKGLAFDGTYLWAADNTDQSKPLVYKIDPATFLAVEEFNAPGGKFPNGLAFDGQYLWIANNESDSLYRADIGLETKLLPSTNFDTKPVLFPNPTNDFFNADFDPKYMGKSLKIYDNIGRLVKDEIVSDLKFRIDMSQQNKGIYYIFIDQKLIEKVVIVD